MQVSVQFSSSAILGPRAVRGVEQESLTVRCRYDPGYESYVKWWCRGADRGSCRIVVKTTGSEKEVKKGRVSIRDNWKDRSFTMTMEKLRLNDSDTYWCGIERMTIDPGESPLSIPTPATSTPATSSANMLTAPVAPEENQGQLLSLVVVGGLLFAVASLLISSPDEDTSPFLPRRAASKLWWEAPGKRVAPMLFNIVQRERPSKRRKWHFSQAMMVVSGTVVVLEAGIFLTQELTLCPLHLLHLQVEPPGKF
ncbi:hypothetical protein FD755_023690 [Muntiacus reevesi]|uniref:Immunoglobulin domain-containing protein n=1 Tax=Muntiacus reevesi TaxID=9886 RepID=A0A5N3VWM4_MUNRE|nr:hypothetical protein FD755_023690 [Muntiacus reevesi]